MRFMCRTHFLRFFFFFFFHFVCVVGVSRLFWSFTASSTVRNFETVGNLASSSLIFVFVIRHFSNSDTKLWIFALRSFRKYDLFLSANQKLWMYNVCESLKRHNKIIESLRLHCLKNESFVSTKNCGWRQRRTLSWESQHLMIFKLCSISSPNYNKSVRNENTSVIYDVWRWTISFSGEQNMKIHI